MPKRKKHQRLPSGYGQIRYLGPHRLHPYAVHPPAQETETGYSRPKALCYVDDWYVGFQVLAAHHSGTYKPGDELTYARPSAADNPDQGCRAFLDALRGFQASLVPDSEGMTFAEVYEAYFEAKFGEHAPKKLSRQSIASTKAAYKNCAALHDRPFRDLRLDDLQAVLDNCTLAESSLELIRSLMTQMYGYAEAHELCDKNYAKHVVIPSAEKDENGVPFTPADIKTLWKHRADPMAEMLLIMCYSGFRISAYLTMQVDLKAGSFTGGIKTRAGKGRVVPIHSALLPLITERIRRDGNLLPNGAQRFRADMYTLLESLGIEKHTPHDCRHTFSALCEKYGVREADRKRMLGHSFGADVTNGVYGHRTLDDLRAEIEKIPAPDGL